MSLAYRPLKEIIEPYLLSYFIEETTLLACRIYDVQNKLVHSFGRPDWQPKLSAEQLQLMASSPLPIECEGMRACGIFSKEEFLGHVLIATRDAVEEKQGDFVLELLNSIISQKSENDELQFNVEHLRNRLKLMQKLATTTAAVLDRKKVSEYFIHECKATFGVKSGGVIFYEAATAKTETVASFGEFKENEALVKEVCVSGVTSQKDSLLVPLYGGNDLIGVLYLQSKETGPFTNDDRGMAETLCAVFGATLSNIGLYQEVFEMEKVKTNLGRYLSPNLVKEVVESGEFQKLGGKRMRVAILFADIRGFSKLSENMEPEQMVGQLNEYFEQMSHIIFAHHGTLDKFVGDMVMVLFGAPKAMKDAGAQAVKTAIEMQKQVLKINARWKTQNLPAFEVGIGINIGEVVFGNIGSSQAMGLTAIGEHVNQAERLESYARAGEILISEALHKDIEKEGFSVSKVGAITVKKMELQAYRIEI